MRRKFGALSVGVLAVALVASGCSETTNEPSGNSDQQNRVQTGTISTDPAESQGPAKAVEGAAKGGVVKLLHEAEFAHLDPQKVYVSDALSITTQFARTLTGYKEDGKGNLKLVGDLATNAGEDVNGDCKVWKYTLKDGLKFEDGTPITGADVVYGISRSFDPDWGDGPTYLQKWLTGSAEYNTTYKGPFKSAGAEVPGLKAEGNVVTFTFPSAQCETPYAVAMPTSAPVPKAKDTKGDYDRKPVSSGPYMIKEHAYDQFIEFVRNPNWDANTDPIRNGYPDGIRVEFGITAETGANRVVADAAEDQTAFIWANVPAAVKSKTNEPAVKARVQAGPSQYVEYTWINTERVTDLKVRQALNYIVDRDSIVKLRGGVDQIGTTITSPTIAGYQAFNSYDGGPTGNIDKAKELLGNKPIKLTYAYPNVPVRQQMAAATKETYAKAGVELVLTPLDPATYYESVGTRGNQYDLIRGGWGADWPSAATVIPELLDGRTLREKGNQNLAYFNSDEVNKEIDRIKGLKATESAAEWAKLDKLIMDKYAPLIPQYYIGNYEIHGSKIGGTFLSDSYGHMTLNTMFVKP
ncbi:ABC transporter [Actinoplanes italicus]|uniref:Peptide/nickel transport system substrate-binding protein n=1 Tax=Actinoplanes italicus TaxID=113567 RepID=A0A2T0KD58_9ACTN|nr:ABC transporter substrate-binding protein [Actinoplanes italicus]PRX21248.1 peptide/nickel transport system substrate-binding protein [Actinoplanes italicus]GIE36413.1 ABC transporter [Actinoplanes italicus]